MFRDAALGEGIAGDQFSNESLQAVTIPGDGFHQVIHHDFVIAFKLATQGIGQQFLRQGTGELSLARGDDGFQFPGRREEFPARKFTRSVNQPSGIVSITPAPNRVKILKTEPDGVKNLMAIGTNGIRAVQLGALT